MAGYQVVQEQLPVRLFEAFALEPRRHCAELQRAIINARASQWRTASDQTNVVFDRSISEDVAVFCRLHLARGLLTREEFQALSSLGRSLERQMAKPRLILYLSASRQTLLSRIGAAGQPQPIIESLDDQLALYDRWIAKRQENVVSIRTDRVEAGSVQALFGGSKC